MSEVWRRDFNIETSTFPNEIVKRYCDELFKLTNKKVVAKIKKFDRNLSQLGIENQLTSLSKMAAKSIACTPEDYLGEISGNDRFNYEIYLSGVNTENYKYRFCFIEHGISPYPVTVVIDDAIAKELNGNTKEVCNTENEFITLIIKILNSDKITSVITRLISINSAK